MMPAGHHSDSDSTVLPLPKSPITWLGGIFASLPPLAAGLIGGLTASGMPGQRREIGAKEALDLGAWRQLV